MAVGRIKGPFGVRGWLHVTSYIDPPENILAYPHWLMHTADSVRLVGVEAGRLRDGKVIVLLAESPLPEGVVVAGAEIHVPRSVLPEPDGDQYYWVDLLGMKVANADRSILGKVERIIETGANDVLVVKGERELLIPFIPGRVVSGVDFEAGVIRVDWDVEF